MKSLIGFASQLLLLLVFILSIKTTEGAVNYKLTSVIREYAGNLSLWLEKRQAVIDIYVGWCNHSFGWFYQDINNAWNTSSVPLITWVPIDCTERFVPGIIKLVNNNTFDGYINQFCDRLKTWLAGSDGIYGTDDDRRAYLRLAHEMNGNWYPWSLVSTPAEYVQAWHHVYGLVSNHGFDPTRLQWIWSVGAIDVGHYKAEEYWVGENYTDWLGVDGYNTGKTASYGKWQWPNEVFDDMFSRVRKLSATKPIAINEFGTTSVVVANVTDIPAKTEWLNRFCDYMSNSSDVKMASYYNIDAGHNDYSIFGGTHGDIVWNNFTAYSAYKKCIQSDEWIESNITNPRLITDEQFLGRF